MAALIKFTGLLLLFSVCAAQGFYKAASLEGNARNLGEICNCMLALSQRLRYVGGERIRLIKESFGENGTVEVSGQKIIVHKGKICDEDVHILEEFFGEFGSADTVSERDRVSLCMSLLEKRYQLLQKQASEQGKLYRTFGICAGAVGCLLFI